MIHLNRNDTVLFIGDSITDGGRGKTMDLNHIMGHGFAEFICARLGADNYKNMPKFVNKGISGDSSLQIYARWGRDVIQYKPSIINLLCGVNDSSNLAKDLPIEMIVENYLKTIESILTDTFQLLPKVKFVLCEPFYADVKFTEAPYKYIPHLYSEAYFKFANIERDEKRIERQGKVTALIQKSLPALAKKYGVIYVSFQKVFDNAAKDTHISYFIWDNIHPTFIGHRLMADRWLEVVEREWNK